MSTTAVVENCTRCGWPLRTTSVMLGTGLYHPECAPAVPPMTAPDPSDIDGPAGEAGDLIERYAAQVRVARAYAIDAAKGAPTSTFEIMVQHFAGFEAEVAARLAALQQERDEEAARNDVLIEETARQFNRAEALEALASSLQRRVEELTGAVKLARPYIENLIGHSRLNGSSAIPLHETAAAMDAALTPPEQGGGK